jgi:hypothetical protein
MVFVTKTGLGGGFASFTVGRGLGFFTAGLVGDAEGVSCFGSKRFTRHVSMTTGFSLAALHVNNSSPTQVT